MAASGFPMADNQTPIVSFKKRSTKANVNRRRTQPTTTLSEADYSSSDSSSENESRREIKRRRVAAKTGIVTASSTNPTPYDHRDSSNDNSAGGSIMVPSNANANDATKHTDWFDDEEKRKKGTGGINKGHENANARGKSFGPMKAPTNVRTITVTDYSPDVCKDFKQTGFCGFGDNCKFLHDRSDYKQGWQLDREWEHVTKGKSINGTVVASADRSARNKKVDEEEDNHDNTMSRQIPFACFICKKPYQNPVVTKCGHYFCESCALQRYRKDPTCAACGQATMGLFKSAKNLKKILNRKRDGVGEEIGEDDDIA